jgi:hypothetical protein
MISKEILTIRKHFTSFLKNYLSITLKYIDYDNVSFHKNKKNPEVTFRVFVLIVFITTTI